MSLISSIFDFLRFNKRNWKAVVLCLSSATVFWFFNALNKRHSANISFPIVFDYNHENYVPVSDLPSSVRINVSGLGWDLLRKSSGLKIPPLVIPLEKPSEIRKIVGSTLPALFATQLEGLQINFVLADTLHIDIDELVRKKFALRIDSIRKYLHPDVGVFKEVNFNPDTVWITGPKKIVNGLPNIISLTLPKSNLSKDFNDEVEIIFSNHEIVKRSPPVVDVSFEVEKLIDVNDRVKLEVHYGASKLRPSILNKEINFSYRLPASLVKRMSTDSVTASITIEELTTGNYKLIPVIKGLPAQAYLIKIDTVRVNY